MMRLMGVKGVSVRQVYAVDELQMVAQPLYGLILLYRYRQSDGNHEVSQRCPDNVWFANQLPAQNSCATLAMFNIIMNADNVELGANLQHFKDFTSAFTPYLRGEAFASFQFVKRIHNSFAKKMDMLEDDMHLSNKVKRNKTSGRRGSGDSNSSQESIEENAHHFIAFVPIDGHVWKLDGMDYQPVDIGAYDPALPDSWLEPASTRILDLMAAAGDQDYSLLSVAPSPVLGLQKQLCKSYAAIRHVESRLDGIQSDWRSFVCGEGTDQAVAPGTPSLLSALGVTQDQLASVELEEDFKKSVEAADSESLLARRAVLVADQQNVENQIFSEMDTEAAEDSKAKERQWDYGPVIHKWLEMLAEVGHLEANIDRFKPKAK
jgi:ubiquitin carboxyl-terminal hydrolase L5